MASPSKKPKLCTTELISETKSESAVVPVNSMTTIPLRLRYWAAMVLSGAGDSLGYKNGEWEFCHSGSEIYKQLIKLGGLKAVKVKLPGWMVSDDTVMLLATGEALAEASSEGDREKLFLRLAEKYKECMYDMADRAPGNTCMFGTAKLDPTKEKGYQIPFNSRGGGCGAAMRSMCIGLRYPRPEDIEDLVAVSVEAGRMTHHHPTGFLGSLASALFTSLALQELPTATDSLKHATERPLREWGRCLLDTLPLALKYIQETGHSVEENEKEWDYFTKAWTDYLTLRNILDGKSDPVFPETFGFAERDAFVKSVSFSGWGGSSGHDAPMIAYDALLGANWNWENLCKRAMFHGGDSDSTGIIAACCFGAARGFQDVPVNNHKSIEYRDRLVGVADSLLQLAYPDHQFPTDDDAAGCGDVTSKNQSSEQSAAESQTSKNQSSEQSARI